jgi:hypothetical protein
MNQLFMKGIDSVMRNPYLKPMQYCIILLFGILVLTGCSDNRGEQFLSSSEFTLGVENLTSHKYLSAILIQLNDVSMKEPHLEVGTMTIGKDSMGAVRVFAEEDEDETLFAVFVAPCDEDGVPLAYPTKSYFLSAFPYEMFRHAEGEQFKKIQIRDQDLNEASISDFPSIAKPEFTGVE